mgnify:CR=1 FL=1
MTYSSYCESADFLRARLNGFTPEALLILGSGLGFLGDAVDFRRLRRGAPFPSLHRPRS